MSRQLTAGRNQRLPEVSRQRASHEVRQASSDQQPCADEVQASSPAILVEDVVRPARADGATAGVGRAGSPSPATDLDEWSWRVVAAVFVVAADRQFDQGGCQVVADLPPVQPRM